MTSSGAIPYNPAVYILDGRSGAMCPVGPQSNINNCLQGATPFDRGGAGPEATITTEQMNTLPLNVPLYLFVDSYFSGGVAGGPYTLRMQDVTIAPASPAATKFDFDADGRADISVFRICGALPALST